MSGRGAVGGGLGRRKGLGRQRHWHHAADAGVVSSEGVGGRTSCCRSRGGAAQRPFGDDRRGGRPTPADDDLARVGGRDGRADGDGARKSGSACQDRGVGRARHTGRDRAGAQGRRDVLGGPRRAISDAFGGSAKGRSPRSAADVAIIGVFDHRSPRGAGWLRGNRGPRAAREGVRAFAEAVFSVRRRGDGTQVGRTVSRWDLREVLGRRRLV